MAERIDPYAEMKRIYGANPRPFLSPAMEAVASEMRNAFWAEWEKAADNMFAEMEARIEADLSGPFTGLIGPWGLDRQGAEEGREA